MAIFSREPVIIVSVAVAAVIFVAGKLGFVLDEASVTTVVAPIVAGILARFFVTPAAKPGL